MIASYCIIFSQNLNPKNIYLLNAKFSILIFLRFNKTLKRILSVNLHFIFIKIINFELKLKFFMNCLKLLL
jgi:hypothetical protein